LLLFDPLTPGSVAVPVPTTTAMIFLRYEMDYATTAHGPNIFDN
jgi:hypothetical protein